MHQRSLGVQKSHYFRRPLLRRQIFLNRHSRPGSFSSRKFICGRHASRPNYLPGALQHRPQFSLIARDASGQKHLLQFPCRAATPRPEGIPWAPAAQNQRRKQQIYVQKLFPLFSFARSERPVNHFQVKACAQFWNIHRCFPAGRQINWILVRIPC